MMLTVQFKVGTWGQKPLGVNSQVLIQQIPSNESRHVPRVRELWAIHIRSPITIRLNAHHGTY